MGDDEVVEEARELLQAVDVGVVVAESLLLQWEGEGGGGGRREGVNGR